MCCTAQVDNKGRIHWTIYVGKNAKLAKQHRADINAPKTPAPCFNAADIPKTVANLVANKSTISCMTRDMFIKLFEGEVKNEKPPLLPSIVKDAGITSILVVFDEIHQIYDKKHYGDGLYEMMSTLKGIKWAVAGISSTPNLEKQSMIDKATDFFARDKLPQLTEYTPEDFKTLKKQMECLPAKPKFKDFVKIELPSIIGDKEYTEEQKSLEQHLVHLVGWTRNEDKPNARTALRDLLYTIISMQMHDGGYFLDTICKTRDVDRLEKYGGGTLKDGKESVLVCYKNNMGARKHMDMLNAMIAKGDNPHPLGVIDLGVKIELEKTNTLKDACTAMSKSFNDQNVTTVGFACYEQHDGHDDFSKLASAVVAAGYDWNEADITQLGARVNRPFTKVGPDEVVPIQYEAYFFDSPFAKLVNTIDDTKLSSDIKIPEEIQEALDELEQDAKLSSLDMRGFKTPLKKLLYADTYMFSNGRLAKTYIDSLRSYYIPEPKQDEVVAEEETAEQETAEKKTVHEETSDEQDAEGDEDEDDEDDEEDGEESKESD